MATAILVPSTQREVRRSGSATLYLLASIVVSLLAASSAPTPLYALYQRSWHFSVITTTIVFGVYALAVLVGLLFLGRLSDHVGRRPVLLGALAGQGAAMVVFATATGVNALLVARVGQGLATGAAMGALGAGMLDVDPRRGTVANSAAPGLGTGLGALASGLVVQFLPSPTHLIYLVLLGVFVAQGVGVYRMPETVARKPGVTSTLLPEVRLPSEVRRAVFTAAPVLFAVWALAGLYGSLGPALTRQLSGSSSVVSGGLSLFLLAGVASVTTLVLRAAEARTVMLIGVLTLILGVAATLISVLVGSTAGFFAASAISGVGFGAGFQGGIRTVIPRTSAADRAGVLSLLYVVSYLGLGGPAVLAGVSVVNGVGLTHTAVWYSAAVIVLALMALFGVKLDRPVSRES